MSLPAQLLDRPPPRGLSGTAAVVGSGPNGLAAAVVLARSGLRVTIYEAADRVGGALRSDDALGAGTVRDLGAAVLPFAVASPVFRRLGLERHGLAWDHPETVVAHPLPDGEAALLSHSLQATVEHLRRDGGAWRRLVAPVARRFDALARDALGPPLRVPRSPLTLAAFGLRGLPPATVLARTLFREEPARALFAGCAAHAVLPLSRPLTGAFGVLFGAAAHARGWPVARGGSSSLADALAAELVALGGEVRPGSRVEHLDEVRPADVVLLDLTPRQVLRLVGEELPTRYARALRRWRYGTAAHKVDYLLDGPVPWRDARVAGAGTVHVSGTLAQTAQAEAEVHAGRHPERPYVLLAQQSAADPSRVPPGRQVVWAYAHTPHGSDDPGTGARVDAQVERFAPGFRDRVLARLETPPAALERMDANLVGGDIGGGSVGGLQLFLRPAARPVPYATGVPGLYLCSSSTPPGGGVHGMCGYHAARAALADLAAAQG